MIPKADIIDTSINIMENICPQYQSYNRGIWNKLEKFIRKNYFFQYILTAPEYNLNKYILINNTKIYVPIGFYKIVFDSNKRILYNIYIPHLYKHEYKKLNFCNISNYYKMPYFIDIIKKN